MGEENGNGITIVAVKGENLYRLRFVQLEFLPDRGLIEVVGNNRQGKSSLLKLIAGTLGGAGAVDEAALRRGTEKGGGALMLSNGYTVARVVTPKSEKGYLTIKGPDGGEYKQSKLNEWIGHGSFDPLGFYGLTDDKQREVFFSLSKNPHLREDLNDVRRRYALKYKERTPLLSRQQVLTRQKPPEGQPPEMVDVSAEMKRLDALAARERERADIMQRYNAYADEIAEGTRRTAEILKERADVEAQIQRLQDHLNYLRLEAEGIEAGAVEAAAGMERCQFDLAERADPAPEIEEVRARINDSAKLNARRQPWTDYEASRRELEQITPQIEALDEEIGALGDEEANLLATAGLPIEGLSFDPKGVPLLNGLPFSVASGEEKITVAVQVAFAVDPKLRVCLVDEANDLDLAAMRRLHALALEKGFQIWACRVLSAGVGTEIVVEDGVASRKPAAIVEPIAEEEEAPAEL